MSASSPDTAGPVGSGWTARARLAVSPLRWSTALWLLLSATTVAALFGADLLPFYDYYQWLYQGHVVAVLLFGADGAPGTSAGTTSSAPSPCPTSPPRSSSAC